MAALCMGGFAACGTAGSSGGDEPEAASSEVQNPDTADSSDENAEKEPSGKTENSTSDQATTSMPSGESSKPGPGSGDINKIRIEVDSMTFDARAAGPLKGEAVILLHGFPETSLEWSEQLKALGSAGYRAVAPDQRGYSPGARPGEIQEYATAKLVQDVVDIADAIGAKRFHLIGHDWGAAVAWATAAKFPQRILSLVPISVPHPDAFRAELADKSSCQYEASSYFDLFVQPNFEDTLLAFNAAGLRKSYEGLPQERIDAYVATLGNKSALGSGLHWYRANIKDRQTVDPPTGSIRVPTAFIWSDNDKAICREGAEATKDYVQGDYVFHELKGVNHWVPELAADEVSKILLAHLKQYPE